MVLTRAGRRFLLQRLGLSLDEPFLSKKKFPVFFFLFLVVGLRSLRGRGSIGLFRDEKIMIEVIFYCGV